MRHFKEEFEDMLYLAHVEEAFDALHGQTTFVMDRAVLVMSTHRGADHVLRMRIESEDITVCR